MTKSSQMNGGNCLIKLKLKCKTKGLKFIDSFWGAGSEERLAHLHHLETLSNNFIISNNKNVQKQN
jgi:hypothetical protein